MKSKKAKNHREVAKDIGLAPADAIEWEVRYGITKKIIKTFEKKQITVSELARNSGTSRARITRILKEDTVGISIEVLLRILGALGQNVKLIFKKAA